MTEDQMRAEFEAAFMKKYGFGVMTASANDDAYKMFMAAEWAWQASRKAVCVELPYEFENGGMYASRVRQALDKAGVKYK